MVIILPVAKWCHTTPATKLNEHKALDIFHKSGALIFFPDECQAWTIISSVCYIDHMKVVELIPVLQMAVGPAVLISGVGLLILSLTNRLGRVVDRGRILARELRESPQSKNSSVATQLDILSRRAALLQRAIIFAVLCVLLAAVLIITLFFTAALKIEDVWLIGGLFVGALGSLIVSLTAFLQELNKSLTAFKLDVQR